MATTHLKNRSTRSTQGFTLIELLTVIAVIALLIAIVVPALAHVLDKGRHTGCVANMRALSQGVSAYAYDNDGYLPAPGWGSGTQPCWLYTNYAMLKADDVKTGQIWPYVTSLDVYRCPADNPPDPDVLAQIEAIQPKNSYKLTSYCMNGSVIAFNRARAGYTPSVVAGVRRTISIEHFGADDIILWEADQRKITRGMWWDGGNTPGEGMTDRHFTWGSVGRVDGGAEKMFNDEYYLVNAASSTRSRLWNVPSIYSTNGR